MKRKKSDLNKSLSLIGAMGLTFLLCISKDEQSQKQLIDLINQLEKRFPEIKEKLRIQLTPKD